MKSVHILKECVIATLLILLFTFFIKKIPASNELRKGLFQGFADFDIYDLHYSGYKNEQKKFDENVVLIEIADTRSEIADQINLISGYQPKVMGIDAIFKSPGEEIADAQLLNSVKEKRNLVFSNRYVKEPNESEQIINSFLIQDYHGSGYDNLDAINNYYVKRTYAPFMSINGKRCNSFTSAIAEKYDPASYNKLVKRSRGRELIDYTGNLENYLSISAEELNFYDSTAQLESLLRNKVVLIGFFVKQDHNKSIPLILEDLHYTPMNEILIGKSYPDMYGVVIHANILSMIFSGKYAQIAPEIVSYFVAFCFTLLFYYYVLTQHRKRAHPSHGKLMLVQYLGMLLLLYLFLQLFHLLLYKVPLEPVLIALVLSLELLGLYKMLALWLHKRWGYQTVFNVKHNI